MENHFEANTDTNNMGKNDGNILSLNSIRLLITTIVLLVLVISVLIFQFILQKKQTDNSNQNNNNQETVIEKKIDDTGSDGEIKENNEVELFIENSLNRYPTFSSDVDTKSITKVFFLGKRMKEGWLVEVEEKKDEYKSTTHYLLTPTLETKLIDTISCPGNDKYPPISLEGALTVGFDDTVMRNLASKDGYLILFGSKNSCYGGANSGFVSVYDIGTGEKIKLQGNFEIPGTIWKGVSITGNALGILRGVYGTDKPFIVVEYELPVATSPVVDESGAIAYFDLQTGKLTRLISFP